MSLPRFNRSSQRATASHAISVCYFRSDKFSEEKHLIPFQKWLDTRSVDQDVLIFHEKGLVPPAGDGVRHFEVQDPAVGYAPHLWRYLGATERYDWTWFRGMDTPNPPQREEDLAMACQNSKSDVLIRQRPKFSCMGKFGCSARAAQSLLSHISASIVDPTDWNCDEKIVSDWIEKGDTRVSLVLDVPIRDWHEEWVMKRLRSGHHTNIFKDRDDRP